MEFDRLGYSVEEFGKATGIGRTTLFEQIRAGKLKARKVGRRTIITYEDGRDYLASLPHAPTGEAA